MLEKNLLPIKNNPFIYKIRKYLTVLAAPAILFFIFLFSAILNLIPSNIPSRIFAKLFLLFQVRTKVVESNLKKVFPQWSEEKIKQFALNYYQNLGFVFVDLLKLFTQPSLLVKLSQKVSLPAADRLRVENALKKGKGLVLLTAHIGNWERSGILFNQLYFPIHPVVRRQNIIPQLLISFTRWRLGMKVLYLGDAYKQITRLLNQNKIIIFVFDQHQQSTSSIRVNFFNHPASTDAGLAKLVRKKEVPVMSLNPYSEKRGHLSFRVEGPIPYQKADREEIDPAKARQKEEFLNTQSYAQAVERMILSNPKDWLWTHRRWKNQP